MATSGRKGLNIEQMTVNIISFQELLRLFKLEANVCQLYVNITEYSSSQFPRNHLPI